MKCQWIDDITYMKRPEPPAIRTLAPCMRDVKFVRYSTGIIVEGYCEPHAEAKGWSKNPWPTTDIERYSEAKHYGVSKVKSKDEQERS